MKIPHPLTYTTQPPPHQTGRVMGSPWKHFKYSGGQRSMRTVAMENVGTEGGEEQEGDGKETEPRQAHLHVGDKQQ